MNLELINYESPIILEIPTGKDALVSLVPGGNERLALAGGQRGCLRCYTPRNKKLFQSLAITWDQFSF